MEFTIRVNGELYTVDVDPEKPLLWVLREDVEDMGLSGTKYSCGIGICGACTVLLDGSATPSCTVEISSVGEREVTTIEGLNDALGRAIKDAWIAEEVSQCGYCQPGQIMKAYDLLSNNPEPSDADIDESMTVICRCGTYQRIRAAIKTAVAALRAQG